MSFQETIVTSLFILVLLLLLNPFDLLMAPYLVYIMLGGILVIFGLYVFIIREHPQDEREELHHYIANRQAYLIGSAALVLAIIVEGLTKPHIDPWLLIVLGTMIVVKMGSLVYNRSHR